MSDRFFLDTNVLVYSFDLTVAQKARRAQELIRHAIGSGKGAISFQVIQEFLSVALRRFDPPMSAADAQQFLSGTLRALLSVHSSVSVYAEALRFHSSYSLSWYDAIIVASAIESRCAILYSEDFQHGQNFGTLKVVNPFL